MKELNKIKVSVIVAVYNTERFLKQCMDSIVNQTLRDIEIICVNDGSTDDSLMILNKYAESDDRVQVYTKENEGLGGASARNYGLERAQGEYISILDSDDFFELDMLEKAVKRAESTNADIVVFGGYEYDERNGNTYTVASILGEKEIPDIEVFSYHDCADDIYQLTQGMAWNKLFRKSFLKKHGLRFQKVKYTDDAYFTFAHMALANRITVLKEYLCYYRINSGNSQTDGLNHYPDSAYIPYIELKKSLIEWGIYPDVKRSFVNCATSFLRYFYDKITSYESFSYLHNKYRDEIFKELDIADTKKEYFYDKRVWLWSRQVMANSSGEILLQAARSYGSDVTTGILRFQFPYERIERESKIVLIGAGIMGRHYYSQLMLSGYCDVVCWAEQENPFDHKYISKLEEVRQYKFDYAVVAYVQQKLIEPALAILQDMKIPENKIIKGGEIK